MTSLTKNSPNRFMHTVDALLNHCHKPHRRDRKYPTTTLSNTNLNLRHTYIFRERRGRIIGGQGHWNQGPHIAENELEGNCARHGSSTTLLSIHPKLRLCYHKWAKVGRMYQGFDCRSWRTPEAYPWLQTKKHFTVKALFDHCQHLLTFIITLQIEIVNCIELESLKILSKVEEWHAVLRMGPDLSIRIAEHWGQQKW